MIDLEKLESSVYGQTRHLERITQVFDDTTKKVFRTKNDTCLVVFGMPDDKDVDKGIRAGRLRLKGCVHNGVGNTSFIIQACTFDLGRKLPASLNLRSKPL